MTACSASTSHLTNEGEQCEIAILARTLQLFRQFLGGGPEGCQRVGVLRRKGCLGRSVKTHGRGDAPCWIVVPLRGETDQHRAKPCPLISPPGVPGTRVCLMFYLGSIASQNRIHPTPRSYREWPAYQESFISFEAGTEMSDLDLRAGGRAALDAGVENLSRPWEPCQSVLGRF